MRAASYLCCSNAPGYDRSAIPAHASCAVTGFARVTSPRSSTAHDRPYPSPPTIAFIGCSPGEAALATALLAGALSVLATFRLPPEMRTIISFDTASVVYVWLFYTLISRTTAEHARGAVRSSRTKRRDHPRRHRPAVARERHRRGSASEQSRPCTSLVKYHPPHNITAGHRAGLVAGAYFFRPTLHGAVLQPH